MQLNEGNTNQHGDSERRPHRGDRQTASPAAGYQSNIQLYLQPAVYFHCLFVPERLKSLFTGRYGTDVFVRM